MIGIKKILHAWIIATAVIIPLGLSASVSAAPCQQDQRVLGIPTWYKHLDGEEVAGNCKLNVDVAEDALPIGLAVLEIGMTVGGLVAVVMVFIGAFRYIISAGDAAKATSARKTIINAAIGLVIVMLATRIVSFIGSRIG